MRERGFICAHNARTRPRSLHVAKPRSDTEEHSHKGAGEGNTSGTRRGASEGALAGGCEHVLGTFPQRSTRGCPESPPFPPARSFSSSMISELATTGPPNGYPPACPNDPSVCHCILEKCWSTLRCGGLQGGLRASLVAVGACGHNGFCMGAAVATGCRFRPGS